MKSGISSVRKDETRANKRWSRNDEKSNVLRDNQEVMGVEKWPSKIWPLIMSSGSQQREDGSIAFKSKERTTAKAELLPPSWPNLNICQTDSTSSQVLLPALRNLAKPRQVAVSPNWDASNAGSHLTAGDTWYALSASPPYSTLKWG